MYEDGNVYSKCQTNIVFFIYYLVLYIIVPTYERNIKKTFLICIIIIVLCIIYTNIKEGLYFFLGEFHFLTKFKKRLF